MLRKAAVIPAILAAATVLAACGGSSAPNNATASTNGKSVGLKLAECLRTHGVPGFPDPSNGGGFGIDLGGGGDVSVDGHQLNVSAPAFQKAMQDCRKYQPQGPPISGAQLAKIKQNALKMAQCMREHGVPNFPDPQISSGPGGQGIAVRIGAQAAAGGPGRFSPESPAFRNAQKVCGPIGVGFKRQAGG
jgi:hypothetical protein